MHRSLLLLYLLDSHWLLTTVCRFPIGRVPAEPVRGHLFVQRSLLHLCLLDSHWLLTTVCRFPIGRVPAEPVRGHLLGGREQAHDRFEKQESEDRQARNIISISGQTILNTPSFTSTFSWAKTRAFSLSKITEHARQIEQIDTQRLGFFFAMCSYVSWATRVKISLTWF